MRSLLALILATLTLSAADPLATWTTGVASIDAVEAAPGAVILADQSIATREHPAQLTLNGFTRGLVTIDANSRILLRSVAQAGGGALLLRIELVTGTVQVDVEGNGPYTGLTVRGAAADVEHVGTLFVVARDPRGVDRISVVRGKVQVRLRDEIAAALGKGATISLDAGQQVDASGQGLGTAGPFAGSPLIAVAAAGSDGPDGNAPDGEGDPDTMDELVDAVLDEIVNELPGQIEEQAGKQTNEIFQSGGPSGFAGSTPPPPPPPP